MEAWWDSLTTALQVFYAIAIFTSALMVLQLLATILGIGDGDADGGFDHADGVGDAGVHVLSVRTVVAFFTGFGWGGVVALRQGMSLAGAIAVALVAGSVLMLAVFFLMRALFAMRYSGTLDYRNAIGNVGNAYVPVPGAMAGPGQVEVLVQGRLAVVRAFTRTAETIPTRAPIRVVDVLDQQTLVVEPLGASPADPSKTED